MGPPTLPFLLNLLLGLTLTMHAGMEIRRLDKGVESLASLRHSHLCPMETKTAAELHTTSLWYAWLRLLVLMLFFL